MVQHERTADSRVSPNSDGPAFPEGPPTWPLPDPEVQRALQSAYADGSWGRYDGPHTERLSDALRRMHGLDHVLLCASGTVAVELALRGLNVGPDDEVIVAGYDFSGNFRAIQSVGARPVLADIDPRSWCLDAARVEAAIGPQTRAVVVSHLHGGMADMPALCDLATRRGLAIVEDACQSPGAEIAGRVAGTWGDVSVLSFGGSKLLTAGRGGAVLTSRADIYQRAKIACERGNHAYPLSQLQAAVLLPQLAQLAARNKQRRVSVARLLGACRELPDLIGLENPRADIAPSFYKLAWRYTSKTCSRQQFLAAIQAEGVAIAAGFRGFTRRPPSVCRKPTELPFSQQAVEQTVLLHHPILLESPDTIDRLAAALHRAVNRLHGGVRS